MSKYKVVKAFKIEEVEQAVDSVIELTEEAAKPLLDSGEIIAEGTVAPEGDKAPEGESANTPEGGEKAPEGDENAG